MCFISANPITNLQTLRFGRMNVISNNQCRAVYSIVLPTNICTSTFRQPSTCSGDSGGPLFVTRNGAPVLVMFWDHNNENKYSYRYEILMCCQRICIYRLCLFLFLISDWYNFFWTGWQQWWLWSWISCRFHQSFLLYKFH